MHQSPTNVYQVQKTSAIEDISSDVDSANDNAIDWESEETLGLSIREWCPRWWWFVTCAIIVLLHRKRMLSRRIIIHNREEELKQSIKRNRLFGCPRENKYLCLVA